MFRKKSSFLNFNVFEEKFTYAMEEKRKSSSTHREWRRLAKKERRGRIRRKSAQERDADEQRSRAALEITREYLNSISERENERKESEILQEKQHAEREKLWIEEEARAQEEWQIGQERRKKAREDRFAQEEIIRKDFEAKREASRLKIEEAKRLEEEETKRHRDMQKDIDEYIDNGRATPEFMRIVSESQSGKDLCPFFTKTGACKYGDVCSRNHPRVALSKVILLPGFYTHFSLEKNSAEYDTDVSLEFSGSDRRRHFREFYNDVVPELENFGKIKTLKFCCNTEIHLRGNLYVEYHSEREAARAWRNLNGRYYAGRRLNCEFVNLKSWRSAVCGMAKCPKGRSCNFLHTFRNPRDEYDVESPPRRTNKNFDNGGRNERRTKSKWEDWESTEDNRNWRWSESPEMQYRTSTVEERGQSSRGETKRGRCERSPPTRRDTKIHSDRKRRKSSWPRSKRTEYRGEEEKQKKKKRKKERKDGEKENGKKKSKKKSNNERSTRDPKSNRGEKMIESDENIDERSEIEEKSSLEEMIKIPKSKWDESPRLSPRRKRETLPSTENEWDTTDSENGEIK